MAVWIENKIARQYSYVAVQVDQDTQVAATVIHELVHYYDICAGVYGGYNWPTRPQCGECVCMEYRASWASWICSPKYNVPYEDAYECMKRRLCGTESNPRECSASDRCNGYSACVQTLETFDYGMDCLRFFP